jgi:dethiobiotin synthetase
VRRIHPSRYLFAKSLSPHIAAALEGVTIALSELHAPATERPLIVELAGGVLVPLNDEHTNLDLIVRLGLPVVVVSRHYLGSINHTLLTLEVLRSRGATIRGVIFNGQELPDTERIIARHGRVEILGRVPQLEELSAASVRSVAQSIAIGELS